MQTPDWQVSRRVHAFPSSQAVPSGIGVPEHMPVVGSQTPASWHWSPAHTTGAPPIQLPAWQLSFWVQRFPSSQAVPSGFVGSEHMPVVGSQEPASWH